MAVTRDADERPAATNAPDSPPVDAVDPACHPDRTVQPVFLLGFACYSLVRLKFAANVQAAQ
jgi:hypothetical protein